jgi:hypothetical protein
MDDEQLRVRLRRADPAGDAAVEALTSTSARTLLEEIMNAPIDTDDDAARFQLDPAPRPRQQWWKPVAAAAALVAVVAVGIVALTDGDDNTDVAGPPASTVAATDAPGKLKVIELSAGTDDVMAMCMEITPELVADMQVAFKGTVDSVDGEIVTLRIDQAYAGTDAQMATLSAPAGMEALIGGIAFEVGQQYFITANDGTVNYCGFSGPVTPELEAIFNQAFPG